MDAQPAYEAVLKRRAGRQLERIHTPTGLGDWVEVARAERSAGWADHGQNDSISWLLALDALEQVFPRLKDPLRLELRAWCVEAVFDGYDLAATATQVAPRGKGRAYKNESALRKFQQKSSARGAALLAGPLAEVASRLFSQWLPHFPKAKQKEGAKALAHAMAGGALIHLYEYDEAPDVFAGVTFAKVKRAPALPVKHVEPRADLIARILAEPDQDEPRLVYADWLAEQADPLGEFIHVQCALGQTRVGAQAYWIAGKRKAASETRQALEERERQLILKHGKRWVQPIRQGMLTWSFRRGFVSKVLSNVATFLKDPKPFASVPVEELRLTGFIASQAKGFAGTVELPTLKRLIFSENRLNERTVGIVASPLFQHAPVLDLRRNHLGAGGVAKLRGLLGATTRALDLSQNQLGPDSLRALAGLGLSQLALRVNGLADGELKPLEGLAELEWLDLGSNALGNEGAARLAQLKLPKLRFLDLTDNRVGAAGLTAIAESAGLKSLEVLDYTDSGLDSKTNKLLATRFGKNETPPNPFAFDEEVAA